MILNLVAAFLLAVIPLSLADEPGGAYAGVYPVMVTCVYPGVLRQVLSKSVGASCEYFDVWKEEVKPAKVVVEEEEEEENAPVAYTCCIPEVVTYKGVKVLLSDNQGEEEEVVMIHLDLEIESLVASFVVCKTSCDAAFEEEEEIDCVPVMIKRGKLNGHMIAKEPNPSDTSGSSVSFELSDFESCEEEKEWTIQGGDGYDKKPILNSFCKKFTTTIQRRAAKVASIFPSAIQQEMSQNKILGFSPSSEKFTTPEYLSLRTFRGKRMEVVADDYIGTDVLSTGVVNCVEGLSTISGYVDFPSQCANSYLVIRGNNIIDKSGQLGPVPDVGCGGVSVSEGGVVCYDKQSNGDPTKIYIETTCPNKSCVIGIELYCDDKRTDGTGVKFRVNDKHESKETISLTGDVLCAVTSVFSYYVDKKQKQHSVSPVKGVPVGAENLLTFSIDQSLIVELVSAFFESTPVNSYGIATSSDSDDYFILNPEFWEVAGVHIPFGDNRLGVRFNIDTSSLAFVSNVNECKEGDTLKTCGVGVSFDLNVSYYTLDHNNSRWLYYLFDTKERVTMSIGFEIVDNTLVVKLGSVLDGCLIGIEGVYPDVTIKDDLKLKIGECDKAKGNSLMDGLLKYPKILRVQEPEGEEPTVDQLFDNEIMLVISQFAEWLSGQFSISLSSFSDVTVLTLEYSFGESIEIVITTMN